MTQDYSIETQFIHPPGHGDETGATSFPIYQTASYAHDDPQTLSDIFNGRQFGYSYTRIANPTVTYLEQHINAIDKGRGCVAVSTGMAALSTIVDALSAAGDHLISSNSIFGGSYYLFNEFKEHNGLDISFVEGADIAAYKKAIKPNTKAIFCEVIGNPKLDIPDLKALSELAKQHNIPLVVDATASTSYLLNAKEHGVDIVWYSATKWISGNGTTLGGLIVDCGFDWKQHTSSPIKESYKKFQQLAFLARCRKIRSNKGASLAPINAHLLHTSLETLGLRLDKQCDNAFEIAHLLNNHPAIKQINYPGLKESHGHDIAKRQFKGRFGGLMTLRLGSRERCFEFISALNMIKNLANLGDAKTLVIHPSSTIYRDLSQDEKDQCGAYDDLVRISIGIEHLDDIKADLLQALEKIGELT